MPGMLMQGAVDAYTDNLDALLSHGKSFQFVDFTDPTIPERILGGFIRGILTRSFGQPLALFTLPAAAGKVAPSTYQEVILRHPCKLCRTKITQTPQY